MRNYQNSKYQTFQVTAVTVCSGLQSGQDLWWETKRCLFNVLLPTENATVGVAQFRKRPNTAISLLLAVPPRNPSGVWLDTD